MEESFEDIEMDEFDDISPEMEETSRVSKLTDICRPPYISSLDQPDIDIPESGILLRKYLESEPPGNHLITYFNDFVNNISHKIIESPMISFSESRVRFRDLQWLPPTDPTSSSARRLYPQNCRKKGLSYLSELKATAYMEQLSEGQWTEVSNRIISLGKVPVMVGSCRCSTASAETEDELVEMGEDPLDAGKGVFILNGVEKNICMREMLTTERALLVPSGRVSDPEVECRITISTNRSSVLNSVKLNKDYSSMLAFSLSEQYSPKKKEETTEEKEDDLPKEAIAKEKSLSVNIFHIYSLLGFPIIDDILEKILIFFEPQYHEEVRTRLTYNIVDYKTTIKENKGEETYDFMTEVSRRLVASILRKEHTVEEIPEIIDRYIRLDLYPHIGEIPPRQGEDVEEFNKRILLHKVHMLSFMVSKVIMYAMGLVDLDDRDSWSNKRCEDAGRQYEKLFRGAFRKLCNVIQRTITGGKRGREGKIKEGLKTFSLQVLEAEIRKTQIITLTFKESFTGAKWGVKGTTMKMKNNVSQTLERTSISDTMSGKLKMDTPIDRTTKSASVRDLKQSQYGFVCIDYTPEGGNCGLIKNLGCMTRVTGYVPDQLLVSMLTGDSTLGYEPLADIDPESREGLSFLLVNGKPLGWCDANRVRPFLIQIRRSFDLYRDIGIIFENNMLHVEINPSRLIRPLLVVEDGELLIDKKGKRDSSIYDIINSGCIEFITPREQEYLMVATYPEEVKARSEKPAEEFRLLQVLEDHLLDVMENLDVEGLDEYVVMSDPEENYENVLGRDVPLYVSNIDDIRSKLEELVNTDEKTYYSLLNAVNAVYIKTGDLNEAVREARYPYTHCEIDPQSLMGVAADLTPWSDRNQAPRNTYQVNMSRQSLSIYTANRSSRFDGKYKILCSPTRPLVETEMESIVGIHRRPKGQQGITAFLAFPFTEEDSQIVQKEALESGFMRYEKKIEYKTKVMGSQGTTQELKLPNFKDNPERYHAIQANGLPRVGAYVKQRECIIGKESLDLNTKELISNDSVYLKFGEEGIVEKVVTSNEDSHQVVRVRLRITKMPEAGDKYSPRNAQKTTVGRVLPAAEMPQTRDGMIPIMITNPHQIPSRMTMEYLLEMLACKAASVTGNRVNGTTFRPFLEAEYRTTLREYGIKRGYTEEMQEKYQEKVMKDGEEMTYIKGLYEFGYEEMYSPEGRKYRAMINISPVFVQALKHHVSDKIQARDTGQYRAHTYQPVKGRGSRGGLRFGEMERDAAVTHGASGFCRERLLKVSDQYKCVCCVECGLIAHHNITKADYTCDLCASESKSKPEKFAVVTIPFSLKYLTHILSSLGIRLMFNIKTKKNIHKKMQSQEIGDNLNDDIIDESAEEIFADDEL